VHEGSRYIVKGFEINMKHNEYLASIEQINAINLKANEIYQQYFLLRAACNVNPNIAKLLLLDYIIDIINNIFYIEILFECKGAFIHRLKHLNIAKTYTIMQQSINTLLLLTHIGLPLFDFNDMIFNEKKGLL
jgi:hypothetical protein